MLHHVILALEPMPADPGAILAGAGKHVFERGLKVVLHVPFQVEFAPRAEFAAGLEADEGFVAFGRGTLRGLPLVCQSV